MRSRARPGRRQRRGAAALALPAALCLLAPAGPARAAQQGGGAGRIVEVEAGVFYHDVDRGQPDWSGERLILRGRTGRRTTAQLELAREERGEESGRLASAAAWVDWSPRVFTFAALTTSDGADFFPDLRWDLELHLKVPRRERIVLFLGGGEASFSSADVGFWTAGVTGYGGKGVLSYRYYAFDNRARSPEARSGNGATHILQALLGREERGQVDLRLLYGEDFLRDFSVGGGDANLRSRVVYLGWRRAWGGRWGTFLQAEWGDKEQAYTRRGLDLRLFRRWGGGG